MLILNAVQLRYIMEAEAIRRTMEPLELIKRVCFAFWMPRGVVDMFEGMHFKCVLTVTICGSSV